MDVEYKLVELYPELIQSDQAMMIEFLKDHELNYEVDIDFACAMTDTNGKWVAIGGCANNILKGFAVDENLRGNNLLGKIIAAIVQNRFQQGITQLFVFTKSSTSTFFENSGFSLLVKTDEVAMLENNASGISRYIRSLNINRTVQKEKKRIGSIVMNCNPFTLGHRHLIEYASIHCDELYIFVVEEDQSIFPFNIRYSLIEAGISDLKNVRVFRSGPYMISRQTFPTYFLKANTDMTKVYVELDISLFAQKIAKALGITVRFVGEEPNCVVTQQYNEAMKRILPEHGVNLVEIKRKQVNSDHVISASSVRRKLAERGVGEWLLEYVPETTYAYLKSNSAQSIILKCK